VLLHYLLNDIGIDIVTPGFTLINMKTVIVAEVYSRIALLSRGFISRNVHVFRQVYNTLLILVLF